MTIIVITNDKTKGHLLAKRLSDLRVKKCIVFKDINEAIHYCKKRKVECVIFDRAQIYSYKSFFSLFDDWRLLFVPVSDVHDDYDIIDAINSHQTADYLLRPITDEALKKMLSNIEYWVGESKSYA